MIGTTEIMLFMGVIFWIFIIVIAFLVIKHLINYKKTRSVEGRSALDIAKERYAKGEVTKEELEEIKKNLL